MPHGPRHPIDDEINRANRRSAAGRRPIPEPRPDPELRRTAQRFGKEASQAREAAAGARRAQPSSGGGSTTTNVQGRGAGGGKGFFGKITTGLRRLPIIGIGLDAAARANQLVSNVQSEGGFAPGLRRTQTENVEGSLLDPNRKDEGFINNLLTEIGVRDPQFISSAASEGDAATGELATEHGRRLQEGGGRELSDFTSEQPGQTEQPEQPGLRRFEPVQTEGGAFRVEGPRGQGVSIAEGGVPTDGRGTRRRGPALTSDELEQETDLGTRTAEARRVAEVSAASRGQPLGTRRQSLAEQLGGIQEGEGTGMDERQAVRISEILNQPNPNPRTPNEVAMEESRRRLVGLQNRLDNMTGNRADLPRRRAELIKRIEQEQLLQSDLAANVSSERQQQIASDSLVAQEYIKKQPTAADRAAAMRDLESAIGQKLENESTAESRFANVLADTNVEGVFRNEEGEVDRASAGQYLASVRSAGIPIPTDSQDMQTFANTIKLSQDLSEQTQRSTRFFGSGALGTLGAAVQKIASLGIAEPGVPTPPAPDVYRQLVDFVKFRAEAAENRRLGINEATWRGQPVVLDDRVWGLISGGLKDSTKDQKKSFEMANRSLLEFLEKSIAETK